MRCSVVIPAYNEEQTIASCIEALLDQSLPAEDYEVIIVDDGSTDRTLEIIRRYPIRCITQPNQGPAQARNRGVEEARGEVILFTDADCAADHRWVEEMLRPFDDPRVAGVKGVYRTRQRSWTARFAQLEFQDRYDKLATYDSIDFVDSHAAAFRRDAFLGVGGFDPRFPVANNEDVDLSYKIADTEHTMVFAPKAMVYHEHPSRVGEYLRLKFFRGYWRMMVYRKFPKKVVSDSYTPQVLKFQIILAGIIWMALIGLPFAGLAWPMLAASVLGFLGTCVPFVGKSFTRDLPVALVSPLFLFGRSTVFVFGVVAGMLSRNRGDFLWPSVYLVTDALMVTLAYLASFELRTTVLAPLLPTFDYSLSHMLSNLPVILLIWWGSLMSMGLYRSKRSLTNLMGSMQILKVGGLAVIATAGMGFFLKYDYSRSFLLLHSILGTLFLMASRNFLHSVEKDLLAKGYQSIRVLILGCGESGVMAARRVSRHPEMGYNLIGFVAAEDRHPVQCDGFPVLGSRSQLASIIRQESIDEVFVALPNIPHEELLELMAGFEEDQVSFKVVSDIFEIITSNISLASSADLPVVEIKAEPGSRLRRAVKRGTDIVFGSFFLLVSAPFAAMVYLLLKRRAPGESPFEVVEIIGQHGRPVRLRLFRNPDFVTTNGHHDHGQPSWEARIFGFLHGRGLYHGPLLLLRVLQGDITLVGHKAEFLDKLPSYSSWRRKRLLLKPGVTGLWQVIDPEEAELPGADAYDFFYLKNQSFLLDVLIILKTIPLYLFGFPKQRERQNAFQRVAVQPAELN